MNMVIIQYHSTKEIGALVVRYTQVYICVSFFKDNQSYIKNILALPSFLMGVNGTQDFEHQSIKKIHMTHKSHVFVRKIYIFITL